MQPSLCQYALHFLILLWRRMQCCINVFWSTDWYCLGKLIIIRRLLRACFWFLAIRYPSLLMFMMSADEYKSIVCYWNLVNSYDKKLALDVQCAFVRSSSSEGLVPIVLGTHCLLASRLSRRRAWRTRTRRSKRMSITYRCHVCHRQPSASLNGYCRPIPHSGRPWNKFCTMNSSLQV